MIEKIKVPWNIHSERGHYYKMLSDKINEIIDVINEKETEKDYYVALVNFKTHPGGNDLMLAKVYDRSYIGEGLVYVEWINGMTARIHKKHLNIVTDFEQVEQIQQL